jgi:hypothetical protein
MFHWLVIAKLMEVSSKLTVLSWTGHIIIVSLSSEAEMCVVNPATKSWLKTTILWPCAPSF